MAKKKTGEKKASAPLFYVTKDKYQRAEKLASAKKYKSIKDAYVALGGVFAEGHGYKEV